MVFTDSANAGAEPPQHGANLPHQLDAQVLPLAPKVFRIRAPAILQWYRAIRDTTQKPYDPVGPPHLCSITISTLPKPSVRANRSTNLWPMTRFLWTLSTTTSLRRTILPRNWRCTPILTTPQSLALMCPLRTTPLQLWKRQRPTGSPRTRSVAFGRSSHPGTGASTAIFNDFKWFTEVVDLPQSIKMTSASGDCSHHSVGGNVS